MQLREINAIWSCSLWRALWNVFVCGVLLLLTVRRVNGSFDIRLGDAADAPWEWISKRNRVSLCPSGIVTVSVPSNQLDSTPLDTIWTNARLRFHRQTQTAYHMSAQYRHGPLKWNVRSTSCPLQKSLPYPVWETQQEPNAVLFIHTKQYSDVKITSNQGSCGAKHYNWSRIIWKEWHNIQIMA